MVFVFICKSELICKHKNGNVDFLLLFSCLMKVKETITSDADDPLVQLSTAYAWPRAWWKA